jgi:hypothetical protein
MVSGGSAAARSKQSNYWHGSKRIGGGIVSADNRHRRQNGK